MGKSRVTQHIKVQISASNRLELGKDILQLIKAFLFIDQRFLYLLNLTIDLGDGITNLFDLHQRTWRR